MFVGACFPPSMLSVTRLAVSSEAAPGGTSSTRISQSAPSRCGTATHPTQRRHTTRTRSNTTNMTQTNRPVNRELLSLEKDGHVAPASPFLISPSSGSPFPFPQPPAALVTPMGGAGGATNRPRTFPVPPPSALLARVAAFLPEMAKANHKLEQDIARSGSDHVNIENVEDDSKPHIEMNLDCGVLEVTKHDDVSDDPVIIIPGVSTPSILAAKAAASSAAEPAEPSDDDDSDESDADGGEANGRHTDTSSSSLFVSSSAASALSRSARKKKKYRVRRGQAALSKPINASSASNDNDDVDMQANTTTTTSMKSHHPLIQEMEE